ncbi:hypothetical protein H8959_003533, partial [Pygathrix nigripes]
MVKVKARVNRFGHIEHLVTRAAFNSSKVDIVAINDPSMTSATWSTSSSISTHGKSHCTIKAENGKLVINGNPITIFQEQDPIKIRWGDADAEYAVESTGIFTTMENLGWGLRNRGEPKGLKIISNASCTTNCLIPLTKPIHDNSGIVEGLMTQKTVGGLCGILWLDVCGALQNIVPASTGAAKTVGKAIPELNRKLTDMAFRVPSANVLVVDLTCHLEKPAKYDDIKDVVKQASEGPSRASWATLNTRLFLLTLTVTPTLPLSVLGLALPSVTTLSRSFPHTTMNLATATGWWPIWPPRSKTPRQPAP